MALTSNVARGTFAWGSTASFPSHVRHHRAVPVTQPFAGDHLTFCFWSPLSSNNEGVGSFPGKNVRTPPTPNRDAACMLSANIFLVASPSIKAQENTFLVHNRLSCATIILVRHSAVILSRAGNSNPCVLSDAFKRIRSCPLFVCVRCTAIAPIAFYT